MANDSFNDPESTRTAEILTCFDQVFVSHDPAGRQEHIADDCVIENTHPAPDGSRHVGKDACVQHWTKIARSAAISFETECILARGDRGEIRWQLRWGPGHDKSLRGVNLMGVRGGQIVEALG